MITLHSFCDTTSGLFVGFLAFLLVPAVFGLASVVLVLPEVRAADAAPDSDPPSVLKPRRYRGRYVPPAGHVDGPDPFAPGPNSPYWRRFEMFDSDGRPTFDPRLVDVSSQLRYKDRNPALGLDLRIRLDMGPQPFMTVNEKIYPVRVDPGGWWKVLRVTAEVGSRQFESDWFAAFAGQTAVVSGFTSSSAVPGFSATFRVEESTFGPSQITVVHDDGRTTSRAGYSGWLTLRETFRSFVDRQWDLTRRQSFPLVYSAVIATIVGWLLLRRPKSVPVTPPSVPVPRHSSRRVRKRRARRG